jgi:hypothetical protein
MKNLINTLRKFNGVQFVNIANYKNKQGERANVLLNVGASLHKAKQKDLYKLKNTHCVDQIAELARLELIQSIEKPAATRSEGQKSAYVEICNGVRMHIETRKLYVFGLQVKKIVIDKAEYKQVKSSAKTIEKNKLKKQLKSAKFRQYEIGNFDSVTIDGNKLVLN